MAAVRCRPIAVLLLAALGVDACQRSAPAGDVTDARLRAADAEPQNWLTSGRDAAGTYFSPLASINKTNVQRLGLAWEYRLGTKRGLEATPIVVDGTLFTSGNWGRVYALDAATGRERWTFIPRVNAEYARRACCDAVNRGVAVWRGRVYVTTLDGYLYALDAQTGAVRWKADTFVDRTRSYTSTGAPQVAGNVVVIGNAGADLNVRGYLSAYDLVTGELRWRFFTVPRDPSLGQDHPDLGPAARTWDPHSLWSFGGGGTVWDSMLFDPKLNLLFVGTGNSAPYPAWQRSPAGGDNLYLASILAIDPDSGRLKWFYQTVPAESWDYTATAKMVMADITIGGRRRPVLMQAPKNGFFYVLDRQSGELLAADKYVAVNWADHVDLKSGRPVLTGLADYSVEPRIVFPSAVGAHSWHPMAYSPQTGLAYIPAIESAMVYANLMPARQGPPDPTQWLNVYTSFPEEYEPDVLRQQFGVAAPPLADLERGQSIPRRRGVLRAWNPQTGKVVWERESAFYADGGTLATGGGLVFQGGLSGELIALSADDGQELLRLQTGSSMIAGPMTYSVGGVQYVAIMAGLGGAEGWVFPRGSAAYKYGNEGRVLAFKLDGAPPHLPTAIVETLPAEPPAQVATAEEIAHGESLFVQNCAMCHANSGRGLLPDLRRLSPGTHAAFDAIVRGGALTASGMPGFSDRLSEADAHQVHAYLIDEALKLRRGLSTSPVSQQHQ